MSYFQPLDATEHERGNDGEDVPDLCACCRQPFMSHNNARCPLPGGGYQREAVLPRKVLRAA